MKKVPDPNRADQKSTDPTGSGSSCLILGGGEWLGGEGARPEGGTPRPRSSKEGTGICSEQVGSILK